MKLRKVKSVIVAEKVLKAVRKELEFNSMAGGYVEMYANCREQGYHVRVNNMAFDRAVSFSEHRNTDSIVVYMGEGTSFGFDGTPNDSVYEKSSFFFGPDKYEEAGEAIAKYFTTGKKPLTK